VQLIEAMLFVGGSPLRAEQAGEIIRGMSPAQFRETVDILNRIYRVQNRPYMILHTAQGCVLALRPRFRAVKEKLFGGPRQVRLSQPMLDTLALVAWRQPLGKAEIDNTRGAESAGILRQLVRLGLIAVVGRADAESREVLYGTTAKFLETFGLLNLNDLPRISDPRKVA
jgi:segregation and condensation protein B